MSENEPYDLVIIGGGPAGLAAGIYAMRAALTTILLEKGVPGGQVSLSDAVENYPGFTLISCFDLCQKFSDHAAAYHLDVQAQAVTAITPGLTLHSVHLDDGRTLQTHSIILATGGNPRKLGIPGEDDNYGKGISYCAVCDGFFFRNKTVVVIGGGDSAVEEGLYLAKLASRVYLVHRRDALRAGVLLQERLKAECKLEVIWNSVPEAIEADATGVTGVRLRHTLTGEIRQLPTDGVFIYIGFEPNNSQVPSGVRMNTEGYIITDDRCATSLPGIFAVGDVRQKYAKQIVIAAADGCTAALAAAHYVENRKASQESCPAPEGF